MDYLKRCFFYCDLTKEKYKQVSKLANEDNRKYTKYFSIIGLILFLVGATVNGINGNYNVSYVMFGASILAGVFLGLSVTLAKKVENLGNFFAYAIIIVVYAIGAFAGASSPDERTTLLLVFFTGSGIMFSVRVISFLTISTLTEIIYLFVLVKTQTGFILTSNITNTLIFWALGCFANIFISKMKFARYAADDTLKQLAEVDSLTEVYNRYRYDYELHEIDDGKRPFSVFFMDLNGLKQINDTKGHEAGDELIKNSARILMEVFSPYGKIFRIGGDEFSVILYKEHPSLKNLECELKAKCSAFHGKYLEGISMSCGYAAIKETDDVKSVFKKVDELMYEDKRRYYEESDADRRKH